MQRTVRPTEVTFSLSNRSYSAKDARVEPDWDAWAKRICDEVVVRTIASARRDRFRIAGEMVVRCTVHRDCSIEVEVLDDESTNLGLLVPNAVQSLSHLPLLKFPAISECESVSIAAKCQATSETEMCVHQFGCIKEGSTYLSRSVK
jgi:hypothetical protein